jgi:class 3 adenylate cyclase/tetratricopeptide (TPR) repeat protein
MQESLGTCARCGEPLPADARFCPNCGAPVAALSTEERKVVTVMFGDLGGSTKLSTRRDPERFRQVTATFFGAVSEELESLRGRAEKFIGDAVMAVWGVPHAHEDDALRAVRAGLSIKDRVSRLASSLGLPTPLRVHVGINTGPVATGSGPIDQLLVTGPAVNLAARLQEAAQPDEILVGETTWRLTREAVEYGEERSIPAEGFYDDIVAWPAVSLSPRSTRRTIPLVNRRRELSLLTDAFERVKETSRPHLFTVLGEPGIGKSRLVDEFLAGLPDEVKVLTGRASPFGEEVTFAPIGEMIRCEVGVSDGASPKETLEALRRSVEAVVDPSDVDQTLSRVGLTVGIEPDAGDGIAEDEWSMVLGRLQAHLGSEAGGRPYRVAEIRAGLLAYLQGLSARGPIVMVFENVHEAQPALLDLIEGMIGRGRRLPLLVVCVGRDDLLDHRSGWGGGLSDAITLRLEPLGSKEARELALAAGDQIDEETADRIVVQTGGNPFFIVETTGMLMQEHPEHASGARHSHLLPPTVQAVVASRIDHLPDEARDMVRKASVFSRNSFDLSDLALVTEPNVETLRVLEDEELLVRDELRPGVWRFRHEMLRDVAYESLAKRDRLRLHLQVADGLERKEPGRWPGVVAWHLEQAARMSLDLDPEDRTLPNRAVEALARAGDVARRRTESRKALDLYERALSLAGPEDTWGEREAKILTFMGEARYWLGDYRSAVTTLTKALAVGGDDTWVQAHACRFLGDLALNFEADPDRATQFFDEALAAARSRDDPWTLARTLLMAGWAPYWRTDLVRARAMFEEALEIARANPHEDRWAEARALIALTSCISPVGDEEECLRLAQQALELGEAMGDAFTTGVARESLGNSQRRTWQLDLALPNLREATRIFRDLDARWELASALGEVGEVHRLRQELPEAERNLREALDLCRKLGERSLIAWTAAQLIRVLLAMGEPGAAERILDDPSVWVESAEPTDLILAEATVAFAKGDRDRAVERYTRLLEAARTTGWRNAVAARVWMIGSLFGPDAAGGEAAVEEARATLEAAHWIHAIKEPEFARREGAQGAAALA